MRVVYFNYLYDSQQDSVGASVHVKEFVNAVRSEGHYIASYNLNPAYVSANGSLRPRTRVREALKKRLRKYCAQLNQLVRNVPLFYRELKILTREQPDVLLVRYNMLNFSAILAARLKGIPVVLEVNSPHAFERKNIVKDIWQIPLIPFAVEMMVLKLADRVVTVSDILKSYYLERNIPADKISVVPNGVDVERFSPDISSTEVVEKHNLVGKVVLGFIGSFHYWHGIENLKRLIGFTRSRYDDVVYLLVGDGPLRKQLHDDVCDHGRSRDVILTGYVAHEDVPKYLAAMDVVLAPYPKSDLFYFSPLKIFEYLAAGKAVLASDIGQIAQIVQQGENGLLYQADNLSALFENAVMLIEDAALRERLGTAARQTILQGYTWQNNAQSVMDIMSQTCNAECVYK